MKIKFIAKDNIITMMINRKEVCWFSDCEMSINPMDDSINIRHDGKLVASFETENKKIAYDFEGLDHIF